MAQENALHHNVLDTRFRRACLGQDVDRPPVWMMRQAGRYMPEYQALKAKYSFWEICSNPEIAAQATLEAFDYLQPDAAIIFSDITAPAWAMGLDLHFDPGPKFSTAVRSLSDVAALKNFDPHKELAFVGDAIRQTRSALSNEASLIGFVGAPFTLACYMMEGVPQRNWPTAKSIAYGKPEVLEALLEKLVENLSAHAQAQIEAGCDAIQIFDTSAGLLASDELRKFAFASAQKVIERLKPLGHPVIYFARDIAAHLGEAAKLGQDVLGVDWTVTMSEARKLTHDGITLMGNLDPTILLTSEAEIQKRCHAMMDKMKDRNGYIVNLGHGVLPPTPPAHGRALVEAVKSFKVS